MSDRSLNVPIGHDDAAGCFFADVQGQRAVCEYRRSGDLVDFTHTEVPAALEGRGLASALVRTALEWARSEGLRVNPLCSYVAAYMGRHPETQDLLAG